MLFTCKKRIGVFKGSELATLRYVFAKPTDGSASNKDLTYWACATTHNSAVEFIQYSTEFNLPSPPTGLKIMVSNWGELQQIGATPMFNKCSNSVIPTIWSASFLVSNTIGGAITGGLIAVGNILKNQVDVLINYTGQGYGCELTSARLRELVYHELGHTQHYTQAGCNFWTSYRNAIVTEMSKLNQKSFSPYGTGGDPSTAPIIATGEMWGNNCEYIYSNRHYGAFAGLTTKMQGNSFTNPTPSGLNCYLNAIENFNPNNTGDIWRWIPQGLPYDLMDAGGETNPIVDDVSGYSNQQLFNALQPDVRSILAFKNKLLQQIGNNQLTEVNNLFYAYHY